MKKSVLEVSEKVFFNADIRKSNADKRRFIFGNICDHLACTSSENLRSRRVFQSFLLSLAIFFLFISPVLANSDNWQIAKSTHFIIHYKSAPEDFIERLIESSETHYNEIADNLGFRRYNFWLWDNRAKIYIYDNAKDYQIVTGQPNWSSGATIPKDKVIHSFPYEKAFFDAILPHEIGHIIFREFVGFDNNAIPLWLDEGVACYQESLRRSMAKRVVKEAIVEGSFMNIERLSNLNQQLMQDSKLANLFYAESVSIIDYLVREFGSDNFVLFCQGLRDKKDLEKALNYAYPFINIQDLDRAWQRYIISE